MALLDTRRDCWLMGGAAAAVALLVALLTGLISPVNASSGSDRTARWGVSMTLSATTVSSGQVVTATGKVVFPDAAGRTIFFKAWNGRHFEPIATGTVNHDLTYSLSAPISHDSTVLVKMKKHYHVHRAGYSHRERIHVTSSVVSAPSSPTTCTTTATVTAAPTTIYTAPGWDEERVAKRQASTCDVTTTATATVTPTVTCTIWVIGRQRSIADPCYED